MFYGYINNVLAISKTFNVASGNWNTGGNWSPSGVPSSSDDVTIPAGGAVTVDIAAFCNTLTFGNGSNNACSLSISGTNSLTVTSTITYVVPAGNTNDQTINVSAGTLSCSSITFANTASGLQDNNFNLSTGTVNVTGNITFNGAATENAFNITGSGTLNVGGSVSGSGTFTVNASGATVNYNGTTQTIKVTTYTNLTLSGNGSKTFATGTTTVNGILSIENGANSNTFTGSLAYGAAATLQYNTSISRTASTEWVSPFIATGGVSILNTGTITLDAAKQFGNNTNVDLNINSGATLSTSASNFGLTFHGDFINSGTLSAGSSAITIAGTLAAHSIGTFSTTGSVTLSKTAGVATFTGSINAAALTINGTGGTLNLGSALTHTFSGQISLTNGTLNGGSSTLNANRVSASAWNGTGSNFIAGTSTIVFRAAGNQTIATTTTFYNLTLNNSGTLTFGTGATITVNNILSIEGVTLLTFTGTLAYGSSATLQYNRASPLTTSTEWINPFVATGGIIIKNSGTITLGAAKQLGNNTNVPLNINSGATLNTGNQTLRFHGDFINAGTLTAGSSTIDISGTTATHNIGTFTTTGSVTMTKTAGIATLTGTVNAAAFTINGTGGTLNAGVGLTHTFTGDISLTAGTLNGGSSTINANSTSATAWTGTGSNFTASSSTIIFGGVAQTINTATTFNALTLAGSGAKTAAGNIITNATLTINSGCSLNMSTFSLTLNGDLINNGTETGSGAVNIGGTATQSIGAITVTGATNPITMTKTSGVATFTANVNGFALTMNGVGGTLNLGSALTHTFTGQISLTNGTLNGGSSTLNANRVSVSAWNGTGSNFLAGTSTVVFGAAGNQTIATTTSFYNLTLNNSGVLTFGTGATITVNNVLSVEGITSLTFTGTLAYGSGATLQYNRSSSLTTTNEWVNPFVATGGIIIKNTGTITMGAAKQIGNNTNVPLNINSGATLNTGNQTLRFHGDFINAGTLTAGSSTIDINGTTATHNIGTFTTTGSVTMTKTAGTATLTGTVNAAALTINGTGGALNVGTGLTHTFTGDISLTSGTLNGGSSTINENNTSATSWNGTGTNFIPATGTVNFGGTAQTLSSTATTFNNLTFSNSGVKTLTNVTTVNAILSMEGIATISVAPTFGASATLQYNTTTARTAGVEMLASFTASGGIKNNNTGTITLPAWAVTISGPLNLNGGKLAIGANTLTLNGDFIGTNSNCLIGNGASSILTIGGSGTIGTLYFDQTTVGTSNRLKVFTYNRSAQTITLGNTLEITDSVTPTAGTLSTGGFLTLISDASKTARIAKGSGSYITGNVKAQRYIPSLARRYRFLSSPISNATLEDWRQEMYVTGAGTGNTIGTLNTNGFDATVANSPSVYTYDETLNAGFHKGWTGVTNTTSSLTNVPLTAGVGYRVMVRGDRSSTARLTGVDNTQNAVTLDLNGTVNTGNITMSVTYNSTGVPVNDGWCLLGNPYASIYDWVSFWNYGNSGGFNGANYTNISPTIYIFDDLSNSYYSYNAASLGGSLTNGFIPSGAAFFVQTKGVSPAITLVEQFKTFGTYRSTFGKTFTGEELKIKFVADSMNYDNFTMKYMSNATDNLDGFDIYKMTNPTINLFSIGSDSMPLATSVRNPKSSLSDTINLGISSTKLGVHQFEFNNVIAFASGKNIYLIDNFTSSITDVKLNPIYNFAINSNPASKGNNRFQIVLSSSSTLPVSLLSFTGEAQNEKDVLLNWETQNEKNCSHFIIERAADNFDFSEIGLIKSQGNSNKNQLYNYVDKDVFTATAQTIFYRLKQVDLNGKFEYSQIVSVSNLYNSKDKAFSLFPNPANSILQLTQQGNDQILEVTVFEINGKLVNKVTEKLSMLNGVSVLDIKDLNPGIYFIDILLSNGNKQTLKFVKQ